MSVKANDSTGILGENDGERGYEMSPELMDSMDELTEKQRSIITTTILKSRNGKTSITEITEVCDSSFMYVRTTLLKFMPRQKLPIKSDYKKRKTVIEKEYSDLTPNQKEVINRRATHPDESMSKTDEMVEASNVREIAYLYTDIIEDRRERFEKLEA